MTPDDRARWIEAERHLDHLLELAPTDRDHWLDTHCADPQLRARLQALLAADDRAGGPMDELSAAARDRCSSGMIGRVVGPYRIERLLGEGGMASVFLAHRERDGVTQRVALKVLRQGVHDPEEQQRFLREQRLLAQLEHPCIARFIDGGFTEAGVPWFALELVEGEPITQWSARLALPQRLQLFVAICQVVAHAHHHLIVHRDLKPSNILVDAQGRPRLLDFGIAKLLDDESQDATRTEQRRLTPQYAAPEQFVGAPPTTATDVYALGVLLHELLVGEPPAAGRAQAPSLCLRAEAGSWARRLRGDLDTIVLKARQFDPARRYANADALAEDLQRHLDGQPIAARPDSLGYRAGKFLKRHAWAVSLASLALIALATSAALAWSQARRADAAAATARAEAERAHGVQDFLLSLLESAAPGSIEQRVESVDDLLERGLERAAWALEGDAALRIRVLGTLGDVLRRRGQLDRAHAALTQGVTVSEAAFGPGDGRTLAAQTELARWAESAGRYSEGIAGLEPRIAAYRDASRQTPSRELAGALMCLGALKGRISDHASAVQLTRSAWEMYAQLPDASPVDISEAMARHGMSLSDAGRYQDSLEVLRPLLTREREQFGARHARVSVALHLLATPLRHLGRFVDAEKLLREAVEIERALHPEPHAMVATALNDLAVVLVGEGRLAEAEPLLAEAYSIQQAVYADDHTALAATRNNLASIRTMQGHYAEAEPLLREALAAEVAARGADSDRAAQCRRNLARLLVRLTRYDEAEALFRQAMASDRKNLPAAHRSHGDDLAGLANVARVRGDFPEAIGLAREALIVHEQALPPGHPTLTDTRMILARSLLGNDQAREARELFEQCLSAVRAQVPKTSATEAQVLRSLAESELALGDVVAAERFASESSSLIQAAQLTLPDERAELDALLRRIRERRQ